VSDHYFEMAQRLAAQRDQLLAEVERLRLLVANADDQETETQDWSAELQSRLADANALLVEMAHERSISPHWRKRVVDHLAAQPATAPTCCVCGAEMAGGPCLCTTRTEAEQRVLEAAVAWSEGCDADEPEAEALKRLAQAVTSMKPARLGMKP
jgi:hypothetical protein